MGAQAEEPRTDRGLDGLAVKIADGDDRHEFRPVPGVVEPHEVLAVNLGDHGLIAYGKPLREEGLGVGEPHLRHGRAVGDGVAVALLAQDDAALRLDLDGIEEEPARVVVEDAQGVVEGRGRAPRNLQQVERPVKVRGGVGVRAEAHAAPLQLLDEGARRKMRASLEGLVLQEMGEASLILALVERAHRHQEPQARSALGLAVGQNDVP